MIKGVINILESDSNVSGIVSSRIYPTDRPQNSAYPFITVELDGIEPSDTKDGVSELDIGSITVTAYSKVSYDQLSTLAGYIRTALDRYSGTVSGEKIQSIRFETRFDEVEYGDGFDKLHYSELQFSVRQDLT